ncbi:MAG: alcohol dehydrogenase catalytic domain-containing protein [bacterium]
MKTMVLTGIREMKMQDVPDPQIKNPDDVKIKMQRVGICGSDVHYYLHGRIGSQKVEYPFAMGHEGAGLVVETGPDVTSIIPGDRIAIEPAMPCWKCDQCLTGRHNTCRNLSFLGCPGQAAGCLSEYMIMPEKSCLKIGKTMSYDQAALAEPLSIGLYSVRKSIPLKNASIGILGAGPIGLSVLVSAGNKGAGPVYVTDKINSRLKAARKLGAHWQGNPDKQDIVKLIGEREPLGLDVVFECCGEQEAIDQAIATLKPGGKLVLVGIPQVDRISFDIDQIRRNEICIQNIRRQEDCAQAALDLIQSGSVDVSSLITHYFEFENTKAGFDLVAEYGDDVIKAMVKF